MMSTAVVFAGGPHRSPGDLARRVGALDADLVVAVDEGLHAAVAAGAQVDLVIGDLDSADPALVDRVRGSGASVDRHPVDKDATDLELALAHLVARGVSAARVIASDAGRMDHLLAVAMLLADPRWSSLRLDGWLGGARVRPVHRHVVLDPVPGPLVSLLPVGGDAHGVRTEGLRWPLRGETLRAGSTRGVSNELTGSVAHIRVDEGVLVAVQPEQETR
jgi:thiamine pyrophosphokinase